MKKYLSTFAALCFLLSTSASNLPDTLLRKLNAKQGHDRLEIWVDWFNDFKATQATVFESATDDACHDAYSILDADSARYWCFQRKIHLVKKYRGNRNQINSHRVLQNLKPMVDSLAKANNGNHLMLAEWTHQLAYYYYSNEDMEIAVKEFKKTMSLYHKLGIYKKDFSLYRTIATSYSWNGNQTKGLEFYARADSIAQIDKSITFPQKMYLKYLLALASQQVDKKELAKTYYDQIMPHIDSLPDADRIRIDYLDNMCSLGKQSEAIVKFEELLERLNLNAEDEISDLTQLYNKYSSCLVAAGELSKAWKANRAFLKMNEDDFERKRNKELLEWQIKHETQEREADIIALELEKESNQNKFKLRLALVSLLGVFGLGVLAFLLYRNKTKQRQTILQKEKVEEIAENRDRLFSSITHDIRTPLALIMGPLERIESKTTDPSIKTDVHLAQRNSKRLMELFNQILDWNKAESKAMILNNQVGQLALTLNALCSRFAQQASEQNIIFKNQIDLPKGQYAVDYDKMDKILSNLIGNAIKFCDHGQQVELQAKIEKRGNDSFLNLEVIDNGPGISKEDQENLFNRFYQGEQGKIKGGTGIGMALVKELIGIMKGEIHLTSDTVKGAHFQVSLPIQEVADLEIAAMDSTNEEKFKEKPVEGKPLILVVEDEPELLEFLSSALVGDYEVEKAGSTNVGLSIAVSRIPDIIISDWTLPDNNGGWLCKELRKNPLTSHIPVLILTAHATDAHQQEAFDAGAVAWMQKPFKLDTLQRQLTTILQQQVRVRLQWSSSRNLGESVTDEVQAPVDPFIKEVMSRIEENYGDEFYSVEKMAEQLLLSRIQLFRKIKNLTGESPSVLLKVHRMEKAKKMLQEPGRSVSEIAFAVGFSDPSYFSKVYKKHFNSSPTQDQAS